MDLFNYIWGNSDSLTCLQMICRGIAVFIITLILIRISGRRSFGMRTPMDNIIVILLGAILSRGVVGASPFLPVVMASFAIVLLHRTLSWLKIKRPDFETLVDGKKIILYEDGKFIYHNMRRALVSCEDVLEGARLSAHTDDLSVIDKIYIEQNGKISVIKKIL